MVEIIFQGLLKYNDLFGNAGWSVIVVVTYHPSKLIIKCTIATTTIIAAELTIHWNEINDVQSINSTGQTIPFLLGLGVVLRISYLCLRGSSDKDQEESDLRPTK